MAIEYNDPQELEKYLDRVDRVFNIDRLINNQIDLNEVIEYYQQSKLAYGFFHSAKGSIHMALNYDGKFDKEGFYAQANIVNELIHSSNPRRVLELASGKGFNSRYLALANPEIDFTGIDLTPEHVEQAKILNKNVSNLGFYIGDFQNLDFEDNYFDLVFEVESICHATDMKKALQETKRVLKPGGKFILFDGFNHPKFESFSENLQIASRLTEISMAVAKPWKINEWVELCQEIGFEIIRQRDLSKFIMPNLIRLQKFARGYFKYFKLSNLLNKILPEYMVKNSIAGIFMPFTVTSGIHKYYEILLDNKVIDRGVTE